jgi:hypothetical protein
MEVAKQYAGGFKEARKALQKQMLEEMRKQKQLQEVCNYTQASRGF